MSWQWGHSEAAKEAARGGGRRAAALAGCVAVAALGWACPSASALAQRGHVFAESFSVSAPDGGLSRPQGLAVDETSGDVYIVDAGANRIVRLNARHQFLEAWGWGVADGKREYERCADGCRPGLAGTGAFELSGARGIAVDNSASAEDPSRGDVYVEVLAEEGRDVIDKFGPDGAPLTRLTGAHGEKFEELLGLAVDGDGAVWAYDAGNLFPFSDAEPNEPCQGAKEQLVSCPQGVKTLEPGTFEATAYGRGEPGLAVNGYGDFYLGHEALTYSTQASDAIAEDALIGGPGVEPQLEPLLEELDHESATGVAADLSSAGGDPSAGDVFVDNGSSVAIFDRDGELVQRLAPPQQLEDGAGVAVDSADGLVYVVDAGAGQIDVFALEGEGAPVADHVSAQDVGATTAQLDAEVDPGGAPTSYRFRISTGTLPPPEQPCVAPCREAPEAPGELAGEFGDQPVSAVVGGLTPDTAYHFRALASNTVSGHTATVQSVEEGTLRTLAASGETRADTRDWELVSPPGAAAAEALTEKGGAIQAAAGGGALAYVASAPVGEAEGSRSFEPTQMLSTRSASGWSAQDIVTPNEHGNGLELGSPPEYQLFSSNLALAVVMPFPGGGPLAEPPLSPPVTQAEREPCEPGGQGTCQQKTIYLRADPPLAPTSGEGAYSEAGIYGQARKNGEPEHNAGYLALVTAADTLAGADFGRKLDFRDATPDLTHAVLESTVPLTEHSAGNGSSNLYEWSEGRLIPVNVLPGAEKAPSALPSLGYEGSILRNAMSKDGARVFWTSAARNLYMTDTVSDLSVQLDAVQGGTGSGNENPVFQTASADGSRVFFTDEQQLTAGSGASNDRPDLYVCEMHEVEGAPACKLTDLTPSYRGEVAGVQGFVLGASEDGSAVYFVANGVLSEQAHATGATPGQCRKSPQPGAGCNLYVVRYVEHDGRLVWQPPQFVARLSNEDLPDWLPPRVHDDLGQLTSRVSPNGRYVAFMSREAQALAGYDNRDANPQAGGAADEEVFLYDADTERVVCVSCDQSGARPRGIFDPAGAGETSEGIGLLVDRTKAWGGHWLAGVLPGWTRIDHDQALEQSRYLSDSGRLYFESPDDLVPQATNGKDDLYEYEPLDVPAGAHSCSNASAAFDAAAGGCIGLISSGTSERESAFLEASEAGGEGEHGEELLEGGADVFFVSAAKLTQDDKSSGFVVYDAHECTAAVPCLPPAAAGGAECESTETCRPGSSGSPRVLSAPTITAVGDGNIVPKAQAKPFKATRKPPTRAQQLAAALSRCRRLHKQHRRRAACEAQARRRYRVADTPKTKATRARSSRGGER